MVAMKSRLSLATSLQHEVISNMLQVITIFCHVLLNMSSRFYLRLKFQITHLNLMNMKKIMLKSICKNEKIASLSTLISF